MGITSANHLDLSAISSDELFEDFIADIYRIMFTNRHVQRNGRQGQRQDGVDVFGQDQSNQWVGIQCKVRTRGTLTAREVDSEIDKARGFNPSLSRLVIATTAPRDAGLQKHARARTTELERNGAFSVSILAWDDIKELLADDKYLSVLQKYYADLLVEVLKTGVSLCRTMVLRVGVERVQTRYEILIGKTAPAENPESHLNLDYYKGLCFISDLNTRSFALFSLPCNRFDIVKAIDNRTDAYAISKWLNRHESIDEVLTKDDEVAVEVISREEWCTEMPDLTEND